METTKTSIDGLLIIEPTVFKDDRGYFFESYNEQRFKELGVLDDFVQDNQSCSQKGVVRGLHFQKPPYAQAKLVRVLLGAVLDFAVDIRKGSPTYGKYESVLLTADNFRQFYLPASRMVSPPWRTTPSSPTSAPTSTTKLPKAVSCSTTRI